MILAHIDANVVELALVSRKIARYQEPDKRCRWAAMSAHVRTGDCDRRHRPVWRFSFKSTLTPLDAGYLSRVVERVRLREGLGAVRKTWGKGYRAMQADTRSCVIR